MVRSVALADVEAVAGVAVVGVAGFLAARRGQGCSSRAAYSCSRSLDPF